MIGTLFRLGLVILVVAVPVWGHDELHAFRRYEISVNPISFGRLDEMHTWGGNIGFTTKVRPRLGFVADFDVHRKNEDLLHRPVFHLYTLHFGGRWFQELNRRSTAFGHFLAGFSQVKSNFKTGVAGNLPVLSWESRNGSVMTAGGGLDIALKPWISVRAVELDYDRVLYNQSFKLGVYRVNGGLVFRLGKK